MAFYNDLQVIVLTGDLNGIEAAASITVGTLPKNFRVLDGHVNCDQGTTNNEISVGISGATTKFLNDDSIASAAIEGVKFEGGRNYKPASDTAILVTNSGSATMASAQIDVTVVFLGYFEHETSQVL